MDKLGDDFEDLIEGVSLVAGPVMKSRKGKDTDEEDLFSRFASKIPSRMTGVNVWFLTGGKI